jgi:hypothetical protein
MTAYHGVEKSELIRSIAESVTWLKKLDAGPVSGEMLRALNLVELLETLDQPDSDAALAAAMRASDIGGFLRHFQDFFAYEAKFYPVNERTEASSLLKRLTAWDAFSGSSKAGDPCELELDEEIRRFEIRAALDRLAARNFMPGSPEWMKFEKIVAQHRKEDKVSADWLDMAIPSLVLLHETDNDDEVRKIMADNIFDLPVLLDTLHDVMDVRPALKASVVYQTGRSPGGPPPPGF